MKSPVLSLRENSTYECCGLKGGLPWDVDLQGTGIEYDYANGKSLSDGGGECYLDQDILYSDNPFLEVDVYNIEVEDHHTYFVTFGVWVHNQNCKGVELFNKKGFPKNLDPTTPLYTDAKELEADIAAGAYAKGGKDGKYSPAVQSATTRFVPKK